MPSAASSSAISAPTESPLAAASDSGKPIALSDSDSSDGDTGSQKRAPAAPIETVCIDDDADDGSENVRPTTIRGSRFPDLAKKYCGDSSDDDSKAAGDEVPVAPKSIQKRASDDIESVSSQEATFLKRGEQKSRAVLNSKLQKQKKKEGADTAKEEVGRGAKASAKAKAKKSASTAAVSSSSSSKPPKTGEANLKNSKCKDGIARYEMAKQAICVRYPWVNDAKDRKNMQLSLQGYTSWDEVEKKAFKMCEEWNTANISGYKPAIFKARFTDKPFPTA